LGVESRTGVPPLWASRSIGLVELARGKIGDRWLSYRPEKATAKSHPAIAKGNPRSPVHHAKTAQLPGYLCVRPTFTEPTVYWHRKRFRGGKRAYRACLRKQLRLVHVFLF